MEHRYLTRAELVEAGMSARQIREAVGSGRLVRARRDHYLPVETPDDVVRAVRVGGRLTCLSALSLAGVFVLRRSHLHVHVHPTDGRLRSPHDGARKLESRGRRGVRLHWRPLSEDVGQRACVAITDALAHSVLCQDQRAAIATLDSALNKRLLSPHQLSEVFALLPAKYAVLRPLVDARAEAGSETLMRLLLRGLGVRVEVQVVIDGVGRVDLLVDGWLIVECDSKEFHSSWEARVEDSRRDLAAASRGYVTLRVLATTLYGHPEAALAAVRGLLASR